MRFFLFILLLQLISFSLNCQKVIIADNVSKSPLEFALFHTKHNKLCGYSNKYGIANLDLCKKEKYVLIDYLGYKSVKLNIKNLSSIDTIFMERITYDLKEMIIIAKRINVLKELNQILREIRKNKFDSYINSYFFLESFERDSILENIKLLSVDQITNLKFKNNKRIIGTFKIRKTNPYFSMDIDKFIKEISFFTKSKLKIYHLFSRKKIKKNKFNIVLLSSKNNNRLIKYNTLNNGVHGYVKYNPETNEINEHEFTVINGIQDIFNSLNNSNTTIVDSVKLHYFYENNHLNILLFKIWINKQSNKNKRNIITKGYIKLLDSKIFIEKYEIPAIAYNSIQEELIYTSNFNFIINDYNFLFNIDSSIYKINNNDKFLYSNNSLTYTLLKNFNNLKSNRVIWSKNKRLSLKDFIFKEPVIDYNDNTLSFLSDLQQFRVNWIIVKQTYNGKQKYYSQRSVWDSNNSKILYYGIRQAELLANMSFDIYEIYRRRLMYDLNKKRIININSLIENKYSEASDKVKELINKTKYGRDLKKLKEFNDFIINNLDIDNMKIFFNKVYQNQKHKNSYSDGDMLAFFGNYNIAIDIYLDYLKNDDISKKTKENILFNLCLIYEKLGDENKFCKYYHELSIFNPNLKFDNFRLSCSNK